MAKKRRSSSKKSSRGGIPAPVVFAAVALVLIALVYFLKGGYIGVQNNMGLLEKKIGPVLSGFGLRDSDIIKTASYEDKFEDKRYIHTYREYSAPKGLKLAHFETALRNVLKTGDFRVAKSSIFTGKSFETGVFFINSDNTEVLTLRLTRALAVSPAPPAPAYTPAPRFVPAAPQAPAPPPQQQARILPEPVKPPVVVVEVPRLAPEAPPAPVVRKPRGPRIAIVLDDFGYNKYNLDELFAIRQPVTISILPNLKYSKDVEKLARVHGEEVMLHLPMQSLHSELKEEFNTIKPGLSKREILSRVDYQLANFKSVSGVNNHMGSEATEDRAVMSAVFTRLKEKNLFFLDSFTSNKSVCKDVAASMGERFARRDVFLDNSEDPEAIKKQLALTGKIALKKGRAIAIGHDRKNTIKVLAEMMPKMESEGIEFVPLSELVD